MAVVSLFNQDIILTLVVFKCLRRRRQKHVILHQDCVRATFLSLTLTDELPNNWTLMQPTALYSLYHYERSHRSLNGKLKTSSPNFSLMTKHICHLVLLHSRITLTSLHHIIFDPHHLCLSHAELYLIYMLYITLHYNMISNIHL